MEQYSSLNGSCVVCYESYFPPEMWANFGNTGDWTTNCCESFHAKFNQEFNDAHANIYHFMEILKEIQEDTYIKASKQ